MGARFSNELQRLYHMTRYHDSSPNGWLDHMTRYHDSSPNGWLDHMTRYHDSSPNGWLDHMTRYHDSSPNGWLDHMTRYHDSSPNGWLDHMTRYHDSSPNGWLDHMTRYHDSSPNGYQPTCYILTKYTYPSPQNIHYPLHAWSLKGSVKTAPSIAMLHATGGFEPNIAEISTRQNGLECPQHEWKSFIITDSADRWG